MPDKRAFLPYRWRLIVIAVTSVAALAMVNVEIASKQRIVREGTSMLLKLAPVDPRSLMQGDYMELRYAMTPKVATAAEKKQLADGHAVVALDANRVARFVRIYQHGPLAAGEHLLRFRKRGTSVRLASDAWFFEEGTAEVYHDARFGELRVAADGESVLVALRDEE